MTKNITVTDENGKIIGSTYPKRALGLVKKHRARWINADSICLCALEKQEDNKMANNIYEILDNQISKMLEQLRESDEEAAMPVRIQILKTLENFRAQEQGTKILDMIEKQLNTMQESLNSEPATNENFNIREITRQKMLDVIGKMLDIGNTPAISADVKPENTPQETSSAFINIL